MKHIALLVAVAYLDALCTSDVDRILSCLASSLID
jgi:hypothetical protein